MMTHGHVPYYRQPSSNIIEQRFCHFFCVHSKPAKPGNERVTAKQMLHCRDLDGLKTGTRSEGSQKVTYHKRSHISSYVESRGTTQMNSLQSRNRHTGVENKHMHIKRCKGGGMNWEAGTDIYNH